MNVLTIVHLEDTVYKDARCHNSGCPSGIHINQRLAAINDPLAWRIKVVAPGMLAQTYKPKKRRRRRVHGFLKRMRRTGGRRVLTSRRRKGRKRLAV